MIKEYFANYSLYISDVTFDMSTNAMHVHRRDTEPWKVTLVDTGEETMTGGRLKRVRQYLQGEEAFCFTYGEVSRISIFRSSSTIITVMESSQRSPPCSRRGAMARSSSTAAGSSGFTEKPKGDGAWINGGFFVLSPRCLDLIDGDETPWEGDPLMRITANGELQAFRHTGFWQRWIRCVTRTISKPSGREARRRGKCGHET